MVWEDGSQSAFDKATAKTGKQFLVSPAWVSQCEKENMHSMEESFLCVSPPASQYPDDVPLLMKTKSRSESVPAKPTLAGGKKHRKKKKSALTMYRDANLASLTETHPNLTKQAKNALLTAQWQRLSRGDKAKYEKMADEAQENEKAKSAPAPKKKRKAQGDDDVFDDEASGDGANEEVVAQEEKKKVTKKRSPPKRAKKDDDGPSPKPKGAKSAYLFFSTEKGAELRAMEENKGKPLGEISKLLGALWKQMDAAARQPFKALAELDKKRAAKELAAWKDAGGVITPKNKKSKSKVSPKRPLKEDGTNKKAKKKKKKKEQQQQQQKDNTKRPKKTKEGDMVTFSGLDIDMREWTPILQNVGLHFCDSVEDADYVIVDSNAAKPTLKVLMALITGKFVLKTSWILQGLSGQLPSKEEHEASDFFPGATAARTAKTPVFHGIAAYVSSTTGKRPAHLLKTLLEEGGATVTDNKEHADYIVSEVVLEGEEDNTVSTDWLIDSVVQYALQPKGDYQ